MISLQQGKNILFQNLTDWFEDQGFYYSKNGNEMFIKETASWKYSILFNFYKNSPDHINTTIFMHSKDVENIILKVGLPNINLEPYLKGENILNTIQDKVNLKSLVEEREKINLRNEEGFIQWAELIKDYMSKGASEFVNNFSYLPNLMLAIEDIEKRGHKNYLEIFLGGIDHLFRVLIISKLCNDENFQLRKLRFDEVILISKYSIWHPYYKKLIHILEKTKPLYF